MVILKLKSYLKENKSFTYNISFFKLTLTSIAKFYFILFKKKIIGLNSFFIPCGLTTLFFAPYI